MQREPEVPDSGATSHQPPRQFIRHPASVPIEVRGKPDGGTSVRSLHNVSMGGLAFDLDYCLEPGALVEIRIPLARSFEARGRVVWCRAKDGKYEMGVQFLDAADAFRSRMIQQILQIEQYKKEVEEREGRVLSGDEAAREWIRKYASQFPNPDS